MRMKYNLSVCIICLISICLFVFSFSGCKETKTGQLEIETLSDNAQTLMNTEFLKENMTRGAIEDFSDIDSNDDVYTKEKTVVLRTEKEYKKAFKNSFYEVDFEKEMLVLYFFTDYSAGFKCELDSAQILDENLNITIWHEQPEPETSMGPIPPSGSLPTHRCFAVKINKVEFKSITVKIYESPKSERDLL